MTYVDKQCPSCGAVKNVAVNAIYCRKPGCKGRLERMMTDAASKSNGVTGGQVKSILDLCKIKKHIGSWDAMRQMIDAIEKEGA